MKQEIRRLVEPKANFECQKCGKAVKRGGLFEYRNHQYVADHIPEIKRCCRNCIYSSAFGSKGMNKRKKQNQIEMESHLYADIS